MTIVAKPIKMARFFKHRIENKGTVPGSLIFIGQQKMDKPRLTVIDYNQDNLIEFEPKDVSECFRYKHTDSITWINLYGIHDTDMVQQIGENFEIHPLLLEDVLYTGQRPKMEEFDAQIFIVLKMLKYDDKEKVIISEQISIIIGENYIITFQEQPGDVFGPVRERIRKMKGRIRNHGCDYLAYALMDTIVDNYIYAIERIGEQIEDLEEQIIEKASQSTLQEIYTFKKEISFFLKVTRPVIEIMNKLKKVETNLISKKTKPFIKDLDDLVMHSVDTLSTYREVLSDYLNIYHTSVSNRMNEVMKVLTIFAAIFIPLTFLAGIYGTNFDFLPELHFKYSYFIMWGVMIIVAAIMLLYFKRKKWL